MLLSHRKRLLELWRIAASYRIDTHFPVEDAAPLQPLARLIRLHPAAWGKKHQPNGIKYALEDMGTLFLKLGQLLSTRRDLVPPNIIDQLIQLQDKVKSFAPEIAIAQIQDPKQGLGQSIDTLFARFDIKPLAAASIAQVHTAALHDGREVVVKVVRPDIRTTIITDFELLRELASWVSARIEAARALHVIDLVEDYRQVMLNELDLTLEADNTTKMRNNFLDSALMYVPEVYDAAKNVMVMERIQGVPISQVEVFDQLGYDRAALAEMGLTIFFTQVFRDNFFHADMHPGNVFVETPPVQMLTADMANVDLGHAPRYIGLDCAIMGTLSKDDQLIVARMLLAVMNNNFSAMVDIVSRAGWIPPSADKHALIRDMSRTVGPMLNKSINEIDFAGVLMQILDIARRHHMSIPPQLMLLLKTLVHVEGLGRDLYPDLDIWSLAKPILSSWIKEQLDPLRNLQQLRGQLPEILLSATDIPKLLDQGLQSLASQGSRQDSQLREIQQLRADMLNDRRRDWLALAGFGITIAAATQVGWFAPIFYIFALLIVVWRILS
ncbi:2-octaprenylphenol hydroxylase [Psychrobacter sp. TAE2020]|uniref:ABC1 kinase family protein n=1 Tax=Psychrobacter sp. TAE2020 TaxID=2846762 RepID=UPI001C104BC0|nr:AarF/UbiB family protein [Psychrobacter sp. TAE2020]MBU5616398.1 2-octaprenylphenol hydroxylase [Psychrobacter sp. TAE2020]